MILFYCFVLIVLLTFNWWRTSSTWVIPQFTWIMGPCCFKNNHSSGFQQIKENHTLFVLTVLRISFPSASRYQVHFYIVLVLKHTPTYTCMYILIHILNIKFTLTYLIY